MIEDSDESTASLPAPNLPDAAGLREPPQWLAFAAAAVVGVILSAAGIAVASDNARSTPSRSTSASAAATGHQDSGDKANKSKNKRHASKDQAKKSKDEASKSKVRANKSKARTNNKRSDKSKADSVPPAAGPEAKGRDRRGGNGARAGKRLLRGGGNRGTLHGEFVVATREGTFQTLVLQQGLVTAVGTRSITLRSEDGFVGTYAVTSATRVKARAGKAITAIVKGSRANVVAVRKGNKLTALMVRSHDKPLRDKAKPKPKPSPSTTTTTTTAPAS